MSKELEKFSAAHPDIPIGKINIDEAENKHWISNELSFKTPEGCNSIAIYVFTGKGSAESRVFVDNIYLERGK